MAETDSTIPVQPNDPVLSGPVTSAPVTGLPVLGSALSSGKPSKAQVEDTEIYFFDPISEQHFPLLMQAFRALSNGEYAPQDVSGNAVTSAGVLHGRGQVASITVGQTPVVVRLFRRGGWMSQITAQTFLAIGKPRPLQELETLAYLHVNGASVPQPCAALVRPVFGGLAYQGALVTVCLSGAVNLLERLYVKPPITEEQFSDICFAVGQEARRHLALGVFQPDLHLGNVLLTGQNKPVLIDFDKASLAASRGEGDARTSDFLTAGERFKLASRWRRSAAKHLSVDSSLAASCSSAFERGLEDTP